MWQSAEKYVFAVEANKPLASPAAENSSTINREDAQRFGRRPKNIGCFGEVRRNSYWTLMEATVLKGCTVGSEGSWLKQAYQGFSTVRGPGSRGPPLIDRLASLRP